MLGKNLSLTKFVCFLAQGVEFYLLHFGKFPPSVLIITQILFVSH